MEPVEVLNGFIGRVCKRAGIKVETISRTLPVYVGDNRIGFVPYILLGDIPKEAKVKLDPLGCYRILCEILIEKLLLAILSEKWEHAMVLANELQLLRKLSYRIGWDAGRKKTILQLRRRNARREVVSGE